MPSPERSPLGGEPRSFLVIRMTALGDTVLITPALAALRHRFPEARIDLLVHERYAPLFIGHPALSEVLGRRPGRGLLAEVRARGYHTLVDLQRKPRTMLITALAGASDRLTVRKRSPKELIRRMLGIRPTPTRRHMALAFMEALEPLGVRPEGEDLTPRLHLVPRQAHEGAAALRRLGLERPLALVPGSAHRTKQWPLDRWALLVRDMRALGLQPLVVGGPQDAETIHALEDMVHPPPPRLPLEMPLAELAGALARCRAVVAPDTGLGHVTAALGVPVVSIFGPTDPGRWRPLGPNTIVLTSSRPCSPCSDHGEAPCSRGIPSCTADVTGEEVIRALGGSRNNENFWSAR